MQPDYFEEIISNKKFDYSFKGYHTQQVDRYLKKMIAYYQNVCTEKKELERKISQYEDQDRYLRKALLRVEETSEEIKRKALIEADEIKQKAREEAEQMKAVAIKEAKLIEKNAIEEREKDMQSLSKRCELYEEQTRNLIGNSYYAVKSKFNSLQEDLFNELDEYMKCLESNKVNNQKQGLPEDYWKLKEEELLVGYKLRHDITDGEGNVIVSKTTIVTPEIIELLIEKELYGELVTAISDEVNAR